MQDEETDDQSLNSIYNREERKTMFSLMVKKKMVLVIILLINRFACVPNQTCYETTVKCITKFRMSLTRLCNLPD